MLYGFSEHDILEERDEHQALRKTTEKAIELAMMGMQEKAREILDMLRGKGTVPGERYDTMQEIIYAASGLRGPIEEGRLEEEGLDEEQHVAMDRRAVDQLSDLPEDTDFDNVTEEAYAKLTQFKDCMERSEYVDATSGYDVRSACLCTRQLWDIPLTVHTAGDENVISTSRTNPYGSFPGA